MLFTFINNGFSLLEIFQKCYTFVNNVVIMYLFRFHGLGFKSYHKIVCFFPADDDLYLCYFCMKSSHSLDIILNHELHNHMESETTKLSIRIFSDHEFQYDIWTSMKTQKFISNLNIRMLSIVIFTTFTVQMFQMMQSQTLHMSN